jgi:hypothetical protein
MYLAPSIIPGDGLYARGKAVGIGDIVIPIFNFYWYNGDADPDYYPLSLLVA